jgi:hypothetical protein
MFYIAAILFLFFSVVMLWVKILQRPNPFSDSGRKQYSAVTGRITKVEIGECVTNGNIIYSPIIEYEFFVETTKYHGSKIGAAVPTFGNSDVSFIKAFASNYEAGKEVKVFFDPINPEDCYLLKKVPVHVLEPVIFIIFGVVGLGMLIYKISQ